jgi:predicted aspartyl protease
MIRTACTVAFALTCLTSMARADDCGPLKIVNEVQMVPGTGGFQEMIPGTFNGAPKLFLLDTGGFMSQISDDTVKELQMPTHDSSLRLYDVSGEAARRYVLADKLQIGTMNAPHFPMMVMPPSLNMDLDGIISTDLMLRYDVDIDFGSGLMRYFSPDHCPGKVVYWSPPAVASVPITIRDQSSIWIPVTLDGKEFRAEVDTGSTRTTISAETARVMFGLTQDSPDMVKGGNVNGDAKLASYTHVFHALSFNGIDVSNPKVEIIPDRMNSGSHEQQTGNRALTGEIDMKLPQLLLGMDILRHLHIYMAFRDKQFYVSAGSPPRKTGERLAVLDQAIALSPSNPGLLNTRCFIRGLQKVEMDAGLQDCDLALKSKPQDAHIIDSRGFVLYQMGRYQDALAAYDRALAIDPELADSLFMRGYTKRKLGDAAGGDTDIAAAQAINSNVGNAFRDAGIIGK